MGSQLIPFLVEAKRHVYTGGMDARLEPVLSGSVQLEYRAGDWLYRVITFGEEFFTGQEVVYYRNRPWWSMVYAGGVKLEEPPAEEINRFLRQALQRLDGAAPFRGPDAFEEGDFRYACAWRGTVEWFEGMEVIFHRERIAYQLTFSGGMIN